MSDEETKAENEEEGPVGGERLRAARRANDISVRDVAKELHLDEPKVRALEKNEFDALGAPVFAKGHLRKYAELVGVSVEDIMTDYYQMNRAAGAPPVVGPKRRIPGDVDPMPWLIGGAVTIAIIAVVGGVYWWFALRSPAPVVVNTPAQAVPAPRQTEPAEVEELPVEELPVEEDPAPETSQPIAPRIEEAAPPDDDPEPVAESTLPSSYEPTPGAPQVEVTLSFSGECWTEISDAAGRRLFYDLGREGQSVTLAGDAPLRLILGDAANVSVSVDGEDWPIPASALRGRLARLNVGPQ